MDEIAEQFREQIEQAGPVESIDVPPTALLALLDERRMLRERLDMLYEWLGNESSPLAQRAARLIAETMNKTTELPTHDCPDCGTPTRQPDRCLFCD